MLKEQVPGYVSGLSAAEASVEDGEMSNGKRDLSRGKKVGTVFIPCMSCGLSSVWVFTEKSHNYGYRAN